jgi:RNA polymerase sigma-70 factor (ECF subfamily)
MRAAWHESGTSGRRAVYINDVGAAERTIDAWAREHQAALYAFALKLCGRADDAHDLVQDTFERALKSDVAPESARAWLFSVLHHLFVDRHRQRARRPEHTSIDEVVVAAREPEPPPAWTALSEAEVRAAVAELDAEFREAYRLHALEGLGYAEIGKRLGVPTSTVGTRIMRARRKLKTILEAAVKS